MNYFSTDSLDINYQWLQIYYEGIRDRDKEKKEMSKEYVDQKRRAQNCDLEVGDKVYVKNMNKTNKLSLNYEEAPHIVESNNNGDVQLRNDETCSRIRRNVVHLKKVEGQWKVVDNKQSENSESDMDIEESEN